MKRVMIFGAKSVAIDVYKAMQTLEPKTCVECFLVSNMRGNSREVAGLPVRTVDEIGAAERENSHVVVATPETLHEEIGKLFLEKGFKDFRFITSADEARLLEAYYSAQGIFPSLRSLPMGQKKANAAVYVVTFPKDKPLKKPPDFPPYVHTLHVGCAVACGFGTRNSVELYDDEGENISAKNPNYCEMTGYYWIWKNRLQMPCDYVGVYHYRRALDISDEDLSRIASNDVDAILPFPMMHDPDIREHHTRYVKESDWEAMLRAMRELYSEEYARYDEIFSGRHFYNYNLIIAKKHVFADYCAWVFPLLARTEELSEPKGWERGDRYTAYMSESLLTLYFMCRSGKLRIYHAGRILYL